MHVGLTKHGPSEISRDLGCAGALDVALWPAKLPDGECDRCVILASWAILQKLRQFVREDADSISFNVLLDDVSGLGRQDGKEITLGEALRMIEERAHGHE